MILSRRLFSIVFLLIFYCSPVLAQRLESFKTAELSIESGGNSHSFTVELAITPAQQAQGLMYRVGLAADAGMLFLYERPQEITLWMRDTQVPLDMIFFDSDGHIVRIVERAVPYSLTTISSGQPVQGVLEVNGGTAERLGLKRDDLIRYKGL